MATFGDTRQHVEQRFQDLVNKLGRQRGITLAHVKAAYGAEAETEFNQLLNGFQDDLADLKRGVIGHLNEIERSVFEMFAEAAAQKLSLKR